MAAFVWVMMGIAIWHFAIWVPDRFWGGIVGAFLGAVVGSLVVGLLVNGFAIPGESDTTVMTAVEAIPGALLGIGAVYAVGIRRGVPALHL